MPFLRDNKELTEKIKRDLMPVDEVRCRDTYYEYRPIIESAFRNFDYLFANFDFQYIEEYIFIFKYKESVDVSEIPLPKDILNIIAPMAKKTYYISFHNLFQSEVYIRYISSADRESNRIEELYLNSNDCIKYRNPLYLAQILHFSQYFEDIKSFNDEYQYDVHVEYDDHCREIIDFLKNEKKD